MRVQPLTVLSRMRFFAVLLAVATLSEGVHAVEPVIAPRPLPYDRTSTYGTIEVRGWTVRVDPELSRFHPGLYSDCRDYLNHHLFLVERSVGKEAADKLRGVPIWLEYRDGHHPGAVYHPSEGWLRRNGLNPEKAGCVELANARNFVRWSRSQPYMVLHEMAHAWHHRFVKGGFGNREIRDAFDAAKQAKLYDAVLRHNGRTERAYAMTTPQEYFAEASEAFFGTNDFYPFVRAELKQHDPRLFELLERLWKP